MATTFYAIRDNWYTVLEALTPTTLIASPKFEHIPRSMPIREFVKRAGGSASFRRFDIERDPQKPVEDPPLMDPGAREVNESAVITIAYPVLVALAGQNDIDDIEKIMWGDAMQIRDAIFSPTNYVDGQSAAFVTIEGPDTSDPEIYYQRLSVKLIYQVAQTIGFGPVVPISGSPATITLGAAAGTGATVTDSFAYDGIGGITFTAGSSPAAGTLFTVTFSRVMNRFAATFSNGDANAAGADLAAQLEVDSSTGGSMAVKFTAQGPSLVQGTSYTVRWITGY